MRVKQGGQAREESSITSTGQPLHRIQVSLSSNQQCILKWEDSSLIMSLLMEGLVGLEELTGHSGRPVRSKRQVAPAILLGPWGTLEAARARCLVSQEDLHLSGQGESGKVSRSSGKN